MNRLKPQALLGNRTASLSMIMLTVSAVMEEPHCPMNATTRLQNQDDALSRCTDIGVMEVTR